MTASPQTAADGAHVPVPSVTATIDGYSITVPKGTLIIRAAELMGVQIPRFCDHPALEPVAMCRMCLVEVSPGPPKPQPACAVPLAEGMQVKTQFASQVAEAAQQGVMEFILANHPLDCPVCDKGGECPLQNQAMSNGRAESRYGLPKATFDKPIGLSAAVLLDRERCVNCSRCTRFADQIAGDPLIALLERGSQQQVGIDQDTPFDSYFSGNTVQICPVGALTSADYRFRSRPFDLVSVPTTCEHCASGCALRTDFRRGTVMRRLAWDDPDVNEEWNCDKGRFAFKYQAMDRLTTPMVRIDGELQPASWPQALDAAARGLAAAVGRTGALLGGRLTAEDAFAYQGLLRAGLRSDNIDFRARSASAEEAAALAAAVAGTGLGVTYAELERAPVVALVAFEPEDESPIVFLRLRKAVRTRRQRVLAVAPIRSAGSAKLSAEWISAAPGQEPAAVAALAEEASPLHEAGAVILVGERAAETPGLWSQVLRTAEQTGARLAWVPRRAGERGALDAGALPGLLPGGRPLTDPQGRADVAAALGVAADALPAQAGLDASGMAAAVLADAHAARSAQAAGRDVEPARIAALIVAGVDPADCPDPEHLRAALAEVGFLVSLEQRLTEVAQFADVVLPVAAAAEKAGTFVDWEGRPRPFPQVFRETSALSDARVLAMLSDAVDAELDQPGPDLRRGDIAGLRGTLNILAKWRGDRRPAPQEPAAPAPQGLRLASWRVLLDEGVLQAGDPHLAATARPVKAQIGAETAAAFGLAGGDTVVVGTPTGSVTLPVAIAEVAPDTVVLPRASAGCQTRAALGAVWAAPLTLSAGGAR